MPLVGDNHLFRFNFEDLLTMDQSNYEIMFTPCQSIDLIGFLMILVFILVAFLAGVYRSYQDSGDIRPWTMVIRTSFILIAWLCFLALLVESGWVESAPVPRLMIFFALSNAAAVLLAFSTMGTRMAKQLPIAALLAFQGFRLPLELILHNWAQGGTIPETMTWSGQNWDIISGLVNIIAAGLVRYNRVFAWIGNTLGLLLLANVARVAVLSSPLPFAWPLARPLQLAFHLPYAFILPLCVAGALGGHILLTRRLIWDEISVFK